MVLILSIIDVKVAVTCGTMENIIIRWSIMKDEIKLKIFKFLGYLTGIIIIVFIVGALPIYDCGYCMADSSCTFWR